MNKCYFQRWEESERNWGVRPDGCSLHIDMDNHSKYLREIYNIRQSDSNIPYEYDRISGGVVECFVTDDIFNILLKNKSIRLMEYELNNLFKLNEIDFK